jgi:hypothetical protein
MPELPEVETAPAQVKPRHPYHRSLECLQGKVLNA